MFCPECGNPCTDLVETTMTKCYECALCGGHYVFIAAGDAPVGAHIMAYASYTIPMAGENCIGCGNMILHKETQF